MLVSFGALGAAKGQSYWDGGGGNNAWSTSLNWTDDLVPVNDGTALVFFSGSTRPNPVVDAPWSIAGLVFNVGAGAFTSSGSSLTIGSSGILQSSSAAQTINNDISLAADQTWNANTGNLTLAGAVDNGGFLLMVTAATSRSIGLSGAVSGAGGLQKTGAGTLTLSASNSHAGGTTLSAGTLIANHDNALGTGTLALNGGTLNTTDARNFSNPVEVGANTALSGQPMTFTGSFALNANATLNITNTTTLSNGLSQIGSARALTKSGRGSLIISNTLSTTGNVTISGGALALGSGVSLPSSLLTFSGGVLATQGTFSRPLGTGPGQVRFTNSGGFAAYGGALDITGFTGSPEWGSTTNFLGSGRSLLLGSTLATNVVTWTNDFSLGAQNRTIAVTDNSLVTTDRAVISGLISGTGGLIKSGTGRLDLTAANTFSGEVAISQGEIAVNTLTDAGYAGALGAGSVIRLGTTTRSGILRYTGSGHSTNRSILLSGSTGGGSLIADGIGTVSFTGAISASAAGAKTLTLSGTGTGQLTGAISNGSGTVSVSKAGANLWVLSGANSHTGNTTVSAGILEAANSAAFGSGTLVMAGGTLRASSPLAFANNLSLTANSTLNGSSAMTFHGAFSLTGSRTLTVHNSALTTFSGPTFTLAENNQTRTLTVAGSGNVAISSVIQNGTGSGADGLRKTSAGELILSGANTYSGATTQSAGLLSLGHDSALGTGGYTVTGGTLQAVGGSRTLANVVTLGGNLAFSGSEHLTFTGTTTLTGSRTVTNSASGTLAFANINLSNSTTSRTLTLTGAGDTVISGVLANGGGSTAGGLTKSGAGRLTLLGSNTYGGNTTVRAGILEAGNSAAFGSGALVMAGGTLRTASPLAFANNLSLTANSTLGGSSAMTFHGAFAQTGSRTLTVNNSGLTTFSGPTFTLAENNQTRTLTVAGSGNIAISSVIQNGTGSGADGLSKTSTGELILSGANTYSGATTQSAGLLSLGHNSALGTGGYTVTGGTVRAVGGSRTLANAVTLGGNLAFSGTEDLTFAGTTTQTDNRTVTNSASGTLTFSNINLSNSATNRTLTVAGAGETVISGVIANGGGSTAGGLTKTGIGRLILLASNAYSGPTLVSDGVLLVNGSLGITETTVGTAATLGGNGALNGAATVNGKLIVGDSAADASIGTLNFNAGLTLTSWGVYQPGITGAGPATADRIDVTGAFNAYGSIAPVLYGYSPVSGDIFDIADFTLFSGTPLFDYTFAELDAGLAWDSSYFSQDGTLRVILDPGIMIPEPGTSFMALISFIGLLLRRRR